MTKDAERRTEETFIGFREKLKDRELADFLKDKLKDEGYEAYYRRSEPSSPGEQYRCTDPLTGGHVNVLYRQGEEIPKEWHPNSEDGKIQAMVQVLIYLGLLPGVSDASLVEKSNTLVTTLLATYQGNAFRYDPKSAPKEKTA